jgi:hypothetical protein
MAEKKISEEMIKKAWHTYLTTGDMPQGFEHPWYER